MAGEWLHTQVCLIPKTMNFARPSNATPQAWVSFGLTHRAESHILILGIQSRQDHWQRSFYFPLPCQDHLSGISLTPEVTDVSVTPPKCLWPCFYPKYIWIIRYCRWLPITQMVLLHEKMINLVVYSELHTSQQLEIGSLFLLQRPAMGTVHGDSSKNSEVTLGISSVRHGADF